MAELILDGGVVRVHNPGTVVKISQPGTVQGVQLMVGPPGSPDRPADVVRKLDEHNLAAMRAFHVAVANSANAPVDVLHIGDSITEGWAGGGTEDDQVGLVLRKQLAAYLNPDGRYGRWIPGGGAWYPVSERFSANDANTAEHPKGLSVRARHMAAGAAPATATQVCDRIRVHYRRRNVWAPGFIRIKIDGVEVHYALTFQNDGPYCSNAFGEEVVVFDSGPLARGAHTLSVEQVTDGAWSGPVIVDGAYFHDGDSSSGVRYWNGSHFGFHYGHYIAYDNPTLNEGWLSAIRQGLVRPALVIGSHGVNEGVDTVQYETHLRTWIANVRTAYGVGTLPSIALEIPPAVGTKTAAEWAGMRAVVYAVAEDLGCAVWDWNLLTGDTNEESGDPYDLTVDTVHPNSLGHRMRGKWLAGRILRELSPIGIRGPAGPAGSPTAYELRGTGMPEGVVTASVGTYYTDTAATNGAIRWVKATGTGNTGWKVTYGDTGARNIIADLLTANGWTTGAYPGAILRRIGDVVQLTLRQIDRAAPGGGSMFVMPTGFYPTEAVYLRSFSNNPAYVAWSDVSAYYAGTTDAGMTFTYATADPWPSTLPGTPA